MSPHRFLRKSKQRSNKGFGLLELLMTLAVASLLILFAFKQYQRWQNEKQLTIVAYNVQTLLQRLNNDYQQHCSLNTGYVPSANLIDNLPSTPLVKQYNVNANPIGVTAKTHKRIYQLIVTATINSPIKQLTWYQQKLNATSIINNNTLEWIILPSYAIQNTSSELWIMNAGLRQFKQQTLINHRNFKELSCAY